MQGQTKVTCLAGYGLRGCSAPEPLAIRGGRTPPATGRFAGMGQRSG
jgi:hypothetical protein